MNGRKGPANAVRSLACAEWDGVLRLSLSLRRRLLVSAAVAQLHGEKARGGAGRATGPSRAEIWTVQTRKQQRRCRVAEEHRAGRMPPVTTTVCGVSIAMCDAPDASGKVLIIITNHCIILLRCLKNENRYEIGGGQIHGFKITDRFLYS